MNIKDNQEKLAILNYTAALLLAAVLFENKAIIANIGHSNDGFYVDFNHHLQLKEQDLKVLNQALLSLTKTKSDIKSIKSSLEWLKSQFANNKYILEKITNQHSKISNVYQINDAYFLNEHQALESTNKVSFVKLLSVSGVYWNNDANNEQLQRIYGLASFTKEQLKQALDLIKLRKEHDHRTIGRELEIFMFDPLAGQGLPIWLPNGMIIKKQLQQYLRLKETEYNYLEVATPVLGSVDLYKTSGHWQHYQQNMFPEMKLANDETLVLRPMSCPHHCLIYQNKLRSYRDLPLRLSEHELLYRYEASGALTGLERVRAMELTDSHIFCRFDQIKDEFKRTFALIKEVLIALNIEIDYYSLSLREPNDKENYYDNDLMWNKAESLLKEALDELDIKYQVMIGEAAFYGPKLDIQIKTVLAHDITVSTIQLDFLLPEKFDLTYQDENGQRPRPIIIHRGLIGTYERFIAVLLEQTKGMLPFWLSPTQIAIIPIREEHLKYCQELLNTFKKHQIRAVIDISNERLNNKVRNAQTKKIPFSLVIGDKEVTNNQVTYRQYGSEKQVTVLISDFVNNCIKLVDNKK